MVYPFLIFSKMYYNNNFNLEQLNKSIIEYNKIKTKKITTSFGEIPSSCYI